MKKHTCNNGSGPVFGRRTAGCPRCDALARGATPRQWYGQRHTDARRVAEVRQHCASLKHRTGGCGVVCTFGDS